MSHRRKKPRYNHASSGIRHVQPLAFHAEQLRVVEKGLAIFAESLQRSVPDALHMTLARLSYVTVLNKVQRMIDTHETVTFDYNELVVISGSLDMVLIDAAFTCCPADFHLAVQLNERVKDQLATAARLKVAL